jgi:Na+-translocating ferredoxin:NAD+ oxidoreductase RnfD subunit
MTRSPRGVFDPRLYQIATLGGLLVFGWRHLEFDITPARAALLLGTVLVAQWVCSRVWKVARFDPRSALISGLSLCLLFRTNDPWLAVAAGVLAVSTKFVARVGHKHLFNPTNIAVVLLLLLSDRVWVSPGQWGSVAWFAFLMACAGSVVVTRAARADVTLAFLVSWVLLVAGRSWWLGEPMAIPLHRFQSGALLLFAFFMISDPKTTPDSRAGRVLFAALVAFAAWYVQFRLFRTNGLLWSLAACSCLVPLIDRLLPGALYTWPGAQIISAKDESHASSRHRCAVGSGASAVAR